LVLGETPNGADIFMQMKRVHCKKEKYDLYCGRPSPYRNPFVIGKDGTREEVIKKFREYVLHTPKLLEAIYNLDNSLILGCWCDADQACHCDVIIELRNKKS
jgi:Domain of unknown function (DUF4326)